MSKSSNISNLISEEQENKKYIINKNDNNKNISTLENTQTQISNKYSIDELNNLKEDMMRYFKQKFEEFSKNLYGYVLKINQIEINFQDTTKSLTFNYNKIIDTQAKIQSELDKLKNYDCFSNNVNDKLISHEVRLNNLIEEFSKATQKYDKIYLDNLEVPGYIGPYAKYKNCQIFFNDVIKNLGTLNKFREKNILDLKTYKEKLESIIKSLNILVDNNNQAQIKYINTLNQKNISDCKNMLDIFEEKIKDVKVDNAKYSLDIMKKTEEMNKKWDKITNIKNEIFGEFDNKSNEYKKINEEILGKFDEFKKEYKIIRDKFFELADFIKDIRFQKNIKNLYSQILYKKSIKSISKSLNELNDVKNYDKGEEKDLELIKNISSIEKISFKNNKDNSEPKNNISHEFSSDDLNEYIHNKKYKTKRLSEYNSPNRINKINKSQKFSSAKNNKAIDYKEKLNNSNNKERKNVTIYSYSNKNEKEKKLPEKDKEESKNNLNNNYLKNKNQKIIIESKFDSPTPSINKTSNKPLNEDSNSIALDNQSTNTQYSNSNSNTVNDTNNYSFSSVNTFCLNNNNNNNKTSIKKQRIDSNDKVIKEMASELEQSTAKKDYQSLDKEKEKIEPKNLIKDNKEVKEIEDLISNNSNKIDENIFFNSGNNEDNVIIKDKLHSSKKLKNENENEKYIIKSYTSLNKEIKTNDLILYGNNPKAIDKKFFMTDKKLFDLEEFTKDKFTEIKNQIDNLKVVKPNNNLKKLGKTNTLSFNTFREKGSFSSTHIKNEISNINNNTSFTNHFPNKTKFINQKIKENKNNIKNFEINNKEKNFDKIRQNCTKSKLYNFEQINQNIFNSSLKKIKEKSNEQKEKEKNISSPNIKEYIKKNKMISRNDMRSFEQRNSSDNTFCGKKKWETIDSIRYKNNDYKRQNSRNISTGNIYLTQKKVESISFNEADIKLVYLNKFVNKKLPYTPNEAFPGEKK